jgi:hypothetical protein
MFVLLVGVIKQYLMSGRSVFANFKIAKTNYVRQERY